MLVAMLATDQRAANARSSQTHGSTSPLVGAASASASYARSATAAARPAAASSSRAPGGSAIGAAAGDSPGPPAALAGLPARAAALTGLPRSPGCPAGRCSRRLRHSSGSPRCRACSAAEAAVSAGRHGTHQPALALAAAPAALQGRRTCERRVGLRSRGRAAVLAGVGRLGRIRRARSRVVWRRGASSVSGAQSGMQPPREAATRDLPGAPLRQSARLRTLYLPRQHELVEPACTGALAGRKK